jgi:hypothetical protein
VASYSGVTAESNNLLPVIGSPPPHLPPLSWSSPDLGFMNYVSTTTGKCPRADTKPPYCGLP